MNNWSWVGRYIAVIVMAVVLAGALGGMDLFQSTSVLGRKLSAAHIVRFLGFGAALVVLWLLAQQSVTQFREQGGRWGFLQHLMLPLVTLIVVACAHGVILLVLRPVMDAELRQIYNWLFIAGIIAACAWLVMALFNQSSSLTEALTPVSSKSESGSERRCTKCGTAAAESARFCAHCGASLYD